jgi:hypothetical protein
MHNGCDPWTSETIHHDLPEGFGRTDVQRFTTPAGAVHARDTNTNGTSVGSLGRTLPAIADSNSSTALAPIS